MSAALWAQRYEHSLVLDPNKEIFKCTFFISCFSGLKQQHKTGSQQKKKKVDTGVEKTRKPPKMSIFRGFAHSRGNRARKLVRQRKFSTFIGGKVA
jgi:hypothetical protein